MRCTAGQHRHRSRAARVGHTDGDGAVSGHCRAPPRRAALERVEPLAVIDTEERPIHAGHADADLALTEAAVSICGREVHPVDAPVAQTGALRPQPQLPPVCSTTSGLRSPASRPATGSSCVTAVTVRVTGSASGSLTPRICTGLNAWVAGPSSAGLATACAHTGGDWSRPQSWGRTWSAWKPPTPERQIVPLPRDWQQPGTLTIPIGMNVYGETILKKLDEMPHLLIAGTTGAGKSVMIIVLIRALVAQNTPGCGISRTTTRPSQTSCKRSCS